jgi:hypothetical protein
MITQYFDINARQIIQAPGTLAPAGAETWIYGDNYNLAIYLVASGFLQTIGVNDTLNVMLFQPGGTLPEQELAIVSVPTVKTDLTGNTYYLINVNLQTVPLAALVQTPNKPASCNFHYVFNPADGERFSSSADVPITVNPDPTQGASGASPVPPGYPTNPNVFERVANRGIASGYATLDASGYVPVAQIPPSTLGGDMLKSVYDKDNNGLVDTCDTLQVSRVVGLGSAATQNVPASGNASTSQVVLGNDTRLSDSRTPVLHHATHLTGGNDSIPVASPSGQGLCPQLDGVTMQIDGNGHLVATTTGSGDMLKSVFATGNPLNTTGVVDSALSVQTHQIPATGNASGAQLVLATDTRLSDARTPIPHQSTHMPAGSDALPLATSSTPGLCPMVDNVTIQISSSKLAAILATANAPGIVRPDNSTITISGGVLTAITGFGSHGARAYVHTPVAVATNTALTFDTVDFDTDTYHSGSTFTKLTVPAGQAGYYVMSAEIDYPSGGGTSPTYRGLVIRLNGGTYLSNPSLPVATGFNPTVVGSAIVHLNAADYIELVAVFDGGSTLLPSSNFPRAPGLAMFRIG